MKCPQCDAEAKRGMVKVTTVQFPNHEDKAKRKRVKHKTERWQCHGCGYSWKNRKPLDD